MYIFGKNEGYIFRFDYSTENRFNSAYLNNTSSLSQNNYSSNDVMNKFRKDFSTTVINNVNENDINLKIDKSFIPSSNNIFMLDSKKMSFVMNPKNPLEIKDIIKTDAIKKITKEPTVKDSSENSELSEYSGESYSVTNSLENSQANEIEVSHSNNSIDNKKRRNEEYYIVNMLQVKLLFYDHSKECIIEVPDGNKLSQFEAKKNEDFKKKDPDIENKYTIKHSLSELGDDSEEDLEDINIKESILIKQIEYTLSKEENQPTITRLKYISFFLFILIIGMTALFLALFLISNNIINENIILINDTFTLIFNTIYGTFHTRELILLDNPKYFNFYQSRLDYIKNNTDFLKNLFSSSHNLLTRIITSTLPISASNFDLLYNTNISTFVLEDNLNIKSIKMKLSSAIIETNTALYNIADSEITNILPTSKDVFYYMYNSINNIYNVLFKQSQIFIQEFSLNVKNSQMIFLYIFSSVIGFCLIAYFFIVFSYMAVGKRKENYLEVFFEIGEGVIKNSLEKCEKFTKKFQSDNISEEVSKMDEAEIINDTNSYLLSNSKSNRNTTTKKRKSNNSKEDKIIKIKILIGLMFVSLFFFVMYFVYQNYLDIIKIYVDIYNNNCNEQAYFLVIFNILREYFFDSNTNVFGEKVSDYLNNAIDDIYQFKLKRDNVK